MFSGGQSGEPGYPAFIASATCRETPSRACRNRGPRWPEDEAAAHAARRRRRLFRHAVQLASGRPRVTASSWCRGLEDVQERARYVQARLAGGDRVLSLRRGERLPRGPDAREPLFNGRVLAVGRVGNRVVLRGARLEVHYEIARPVDVEERRSRAQSSGSPDGLANPPSSPFPLAGQDRVRPTSPRSAGSRTMLVPR